MGPVIDADMHLMEPPDMWAGYADPADRPHALSLTTDDLGYTWVTHRGRRLELALAQTPGDTEQVGRFMNAVRSGTPAERTYDEATPPSYWDPSARVAFLDQQGIDEAVCFPNYGLVIERPLYDDLPATLVNMGAWNRYIVDVVTESKGRLHPVGHVTLRDLDWLDDQLGALRAGGVRLAMTAPALVDGKRLSHPDLDRAWSSFEHHGVSPVFHVGSFTRPFDPAWYEDDFDDGNPVLSSVFLGTAPALSLADLAVHGVFERHPDLRLGVMELSSVWYPLFLLTLDGGFDFHARFNGRPLTDLARKPSEYVQDHVRIASFAYEMPDRLMAKAGDVFMFCSDYPHSEGTATVRDDYRRWCPGAAEPEQAPGLFGANAAWLLRQT
jgi:predicted TIM-barrel fold metal-dependent hydrolase